MHFILRDDHKSVLLALTDLRSEANIGLTRIGVGRLVEKSLTSIPCFIYGGAELSHFHAQIEDRIKEGDLVSTLPLKRAQVYFSSTWHTHASQESIIQSLHYGRKPTAHNSSYAGFHSKVYFPVTGRPASS